MALVPNRFLFRIAYPCRYVKAMPRDEDGPLLDLPDACRLENFAEMDGEQNFADVRVAWNELGVGLQAEIRGKDRLPEGDSSRPRASDGLTIWIDTRDARTSHRASRYCHQFHLLPRGGGPDRDEPALLQTRIHRALEDAPLSPAGTVPFRVSLTRNGYLAHVFFPATALHGYDPEQDRRMGFFYTVHDAELGDQVLSVGADFPYPEDPSLWSTLELVK